jgi:sulfatase modifying factor 1
VPGGTYYQSYENDGNGAMYETEPATVSGLRLDKYLVTVGRFRQFVAAWNNGGGWTPGNGSGKHGYLNGGQGLSMVGGGYESGWDAADWDITPRINPTNASLSSCSPSTWTNSASTQENLPMNCVTWFEAYAFCIWDGGFLPSAAEWEYAAVGGSQQREYPWGSTTPGTACPGTGCEYAIYDCNYPNGPELCTGAPSIANIAPVGFASMGAGAWGQLDFVGELMQLNLDYFSCTSFSCTNCANLTQASYRVVQGGQFDEPLTMYPPRGSFPPENRYYLDGLRCARAP